jgi:hypothetical protein
VLQPRPARRGSHLDQQVDRGAADVDVRIVLDDLDQPRLDTGMAQRLEDVDREDPDVRVGVGEQVVHQHADLVGEFLHRLDCLVAQRRVLAAQAFDQPRDRHVVAQPGQRGQDHFAYRRVVLHAQPLDQRCGGIRTIGEVARGPAARGRRAFGQRRHEVGTIAGALALVACDRFGCWFLDECHRGPR